MSRTSAIPKHRKVREILRGRILSGQYAPGMRMPSAVMLFQEFKASDSTVIRALNDLAQEGLIVRRRGSGTFVADQQKPMLMQGRHLKLGVLWLHSVRASEFDSFCHRLSLGAMKAWGMEGVEPVLDEDRARTYTRGRWEEPARGLTVECLGNEWGGQKRTPSLKTVKDNGYDGLVTVGIIEELWLEKLLGLGLPTVVVDFPSQRLGKRADLVYADPSIGYRDAVDYFIAQEKRRIHFVAHLAWNPHKKVPDTSRKSGFRYGKRVDPDSYLRIAAFRQAMDAHGLMVPDEDIHYLAGDAEMALAGHLARLPSSERPEVLICHDLEHANKMITACAAHGLKIEAAGGSTRTRIAPACNILLNVQEMGEVAGELLLRRLKLETRPYLNVGIQMAFVSHDAQVVEV